MTDMSERILIEDPGWYLDDPYTKFAQLRREDPFHYYAPLDTFVITRYEDVRAISRDYEHFTVRNGVMLNHVKHEGLIDHFFPPSGEKIMGSDPPEHKDVRRFLAPSFTPSAIRSLEDSVRRLTVDLFDKVEPGKSFDICDMITSVLPIQVIASLMGLPVTDVEQIWYWADLVLMTNADLEPERLLDAARRLEPVHGYLDGHCERLRGDTSTQLIPTILRGLLRGEPVPRDTIHAWLQEFLVAGHKTTRDYLSGTVHAFAEHPEQFRRLRETPPILSTAVEECLRWVSPVRAHVRTVVEDTEYNGQPMRRGQRTWLLYMSANRDETVWPDADTFDIGRSPVPGNLTFGFGEHACIGAAIARLEGKVFIEELAKRFSRIEITGEPVTPNSIQHNAFDHLPVALIP
jgi:cytochrome P450